MNTKKDHPDESPTNPHQPEDENPLVLEVLSMFRQSVMDIVKAPEALPLLEKWEMIREKWERTEALAIQLGRKAGVPEEYLRRFAIEVAERELRNGDFTFAAKFMKNHGLGTPELLTRLEELGRRQKEEAAARKAASANRVRPEEFIGLPSEEKATMADLFVLLRQASQALQDRFENDLEDQYGWLFMTFFDVEKSPEKARAIRVTEFFEESGDDIQVSLPLLRFA